MSGSDTLAQLDDRIVARALAEARARYADEMTAARCIDLCRDAVEAARWTRTRLRLLRQEWLVAG